METCPECGNHDVHAIELDGSIVHECGLCGEQYGDRHSVVGVVRAKAADQRGIDRAIWPLARVLEQLPGLDLGATSAGKGTKLPFVDLVVSGHEALLQVENLAKAMRLAEGSLRCRWRIEARFDHTLVFLVSPALMGSTLRDARIDIEVLAQHIHRGMRLTWWRHANVTEKG